MKKSEAMKLIGLATDKPLDLFKVIVSMIDEVDEPKPEKKVVPKKAEKKAEPKKPEKKEPKKVEKKPRICEVCGKPITGRGNKKMCDICRTAKDILA